MSGVAVLTLDIGLTNAKATLFDTTGRPLAQAGRRYPTSSPQPDWSEQDPQDWWAALREAIPELLAQPGAAEVEILAISATAHMHGLIALDQSGQPLTKVWTLFDRRAESLAGEIAERLGPRRAYELTGGRLESYTPAAKIYWMRRERSDQFDQAAKFLGPKDMLRHLLGGENVTDPLDAAGTLLWDLRERTWSEEICEGLGISPTQLPEVREATAGAGVLSEQAAAELGLPAGIPLVVGAGDDVEVLGAGVVEPGQTLEHIGTTGTVITCLDNAGFDPERRVELYPHPISGLYLLGGATNAAGRSLDWARRWYQRDVEVPELLPLSYPPPPGRPRPPLYLPFIKGERGLLWEAGATGAFFGLREEHSREDLALAVYEGVALSLLEIVAANRRLGAAPREIISGTPLGEEGWARLRADMYGVPLLFPAAEDLTGLGAALLALVNRGVYPDLATAARATAEVATRVESDPARTALYEEVRTVYMRALDGLTPLFADLNALPAEA